MRDMQGIFDTTTSSPLNSVNLAFVRTCSNDAFMGNRGPIHSNSSAGGPGLSWHFRGKAIIDAVFADLRNRYGLGSVVGDRAIFAGCSSGARGALIHTDYVAAELAGKATVVGLYDSPIWLKLAPFRESFVSFDEQTRKFFSFANASAAVSSDCRAVYSGDNEWKCLRGSSRLRFVTSPYFLTQSQYDLFGVSVNIFGRYAPFVPLSPRAKTYAETYRWELVKALPIPKRGSGQVIFSTACYTHCTLTSHTFYKIEADRINMYHLLQRWLVTIGTDIEHATGYVLDRCEGFNCCRHGLATTTSPSPSITTGAPAASISLGWLQLPAWFHLPGWL